LEQILSSGGGIRCRIAKKILNGLPAGRQPKFITASANLKQMLRPPRSSSIASFYNPKNNPLGNGISASNTRI
jgi:hypothetical protein